LLGKSTARERDGGAPLDGAILTFTQHQPSHRPLGGFDDQDLVDIVLGVLA